MPIHAFWSRLDSFNSPTGTRLTAVPILFERDLNFATKQHLIYYLDENGEIKAFIVQLLADDFKPKRIKRQSAQPEKMFSGKAIYYTEEGFFLGGQSFKNGVQLKRKLVVMLDGIEMGLQGITPPPPKIEYVPD